MDLQTLTFIGLGLYFALMIAIGLWAGRKQDHEGFVIGNRNVGLIHMAASVGAGYRGVAFVWFWVSMGYNSGYAPLWMLAGFTLGAIGVGVVGPRVREMGWGRNYITTGPMVEDQIGRNTRRTMTGFILVLALSYAAANLFVLGDILSQATGWRSAWTLPAMAFLILFYLWMGGFLTVIKTDLFQYIIIAVILAAPFMINIPGDKIRDVGSLNNLGMVENISMLVSGFIIYFANADLWQRIFAARDDRAARYGVILGQFMIAILNIALIVLGIAATAYYPDAAAFTGIDALFQDARIAPSALALLLVIFLAMGMSTIDTQTYLFTSTLIREYFLTSPNYDRTQYIRLSRYLMTAFLGLITIMAVMFDDLIQVVMGLIGLWSILGVVFFAAVALDLPKSRLLDWGMSAALLAGAAAFAIVQIQGYGSFFASAVPALIAAVAALGAGSIAVARNPGK